MVVVEFVRWLELRLGIGSVDVLGRVLSVRLS